LYGKRKGNPISRPRGKIRKRRDIEKGFLNSGEKGKAQEKKVEFIHVPRSAPTEKEEDGEQGKKEGRRVILEKNPPQVQTTKREGGVPAVRERGEESPLSAEGLPRVAYRISILGKGEKRTKIGPWWNFVAQQEEKGKKKGGGKAPSGLQG